MISKESLVLVAVLIVLVISFMYWSTTQTENIQTSVDQSINEILEV